MSILYKCIGTDSNTTVHCTVHYYTQHATHCKQEVPHGPNAGNAAHAQFLQLSLGEARSLSRHGDA